MRMPDLATTGSPMTLIRILAAIGEAVTRGQTILEVETDKAVMNVESTVDGVLKSLAVEEGAEVVAGQVVAIFEVRPSSLPPRIIQNDAAAMVSQASASTATPMSSPPSTVAANADRISFFARNRARAGWDVAAGAIADAQRCRAGRRQADAGEQADRSAFLPPDVGECRGLVKRRAAAAEPKPVWDAFFVIAAARALGDTPLRLPLRRRQVDAPRTRRDRRGRRSRRRPLHDRDRRSNRQGRPSRSPMRSCAGRAVEGRRRPGAAGAATSLTISNLGGSNVETFTAVVNTPEAAILAVGKIMPSAVVVDGRIVVQNRVNLTLSVDHRVAGGKAAAGFLGEIVRELESF